MTIILNKLQQGSPEWILERVGNITMSNAKAMLTGGKGLTRKSYLISVASEIITGVPAETYKSWMMERGNILEPFAHKAYEKKTGNRMFSVGLGYLDEKRRISASPDGINHLCGAEIKCQLPKNHLATLVNGVNPKEFGDQMQGCMWVFERDSWDYVSYCPEFDDNPIFIHTVYRDDEVIKRLEESCLRGVEEIDEMVKNGIGKASSELKGISKLALETVESFRNVEPEFI